MTSTSIRRPRSRACSRCSLDRSASSRREPTAHAFVSSSPPAPNNPHATGVAHVSQIRLPPARRATRVRACRDRRRRRGVHESGDIDRRRRRDAGRLAHDAGPEPRSARRSQGRLVGRGPGRVEHASSSPRRSPPEKFLGQTNSDLAFIGPYAIQGSYNGYQVWDISDPAHPTLKVGYFCPASQSDVSVYKNLLFVSAEAGTARLDCGAQGVSRTVSQERIRGVRIFDITDIAQPEVHRATCRRAVDRTRTRCSSIRKTRTTCTSTSPARLLRDPLKSSRAARVCRRSKDPNSPLFRIEVIKVPLAHPEQAAIVSSPRIFNDLTKPATHGQSVADKEDIAAARARGRVRREGLRRRLRAAAAALIKPLLDSVVPSARRHGVRNQCRQRRSSRGSIQGMVDKMVRSPGRPERWPDAVPRHHGVSGRSVYAGGACEGYGLLLDIHDPAHPVRIDAAADSNFSYWHSATFNNDGTKVLFSDEWGGGGAPKCRATDPKQWGADALFTIDASHKMHFQGYYKMPAPQTSQENCVAHNGSLIPDAGPRHHGAGVVSGRHLGVRLDGRRRTPRRSASSTAVRSMEPAWRWAARGPCTGTTARS